MEQIQSERVRKISDAFKAWHSGSVLTDEQRDLINEASALCALRARGINL